MRVFLDANVLFSASNVGSNVVSLIALLCERQTAVACNLAIEEARKNVALKRPAWRPGFDELLKRVDILPSILFELQIQLDRKDAPLLCAAIRGRCSHFVTGDKRDFGHLYGQVVQGVEVISLLRLAKLQTV